MSVATTVICLLRAAHVSHPPILPTGCIGFVLGAHNATAGWQPVPGSVEDALAEIWHRFAEQPKVLLAADALLPEYWWERLSTGIVVADAFDVLSPLGPDADVDTIELTRATDRDCWLHAAHALCEANTIHPGLSWWRAGTPPPARLPASADSGLRCARIPFLFVGVPQVQATGTASPVQLALRRRIVQAHACATGLAGDGLPGVDQRPVILHILHGWGGGIWQFVRSLRKHDPAHHHLALVSHGDPQRREHGQRLALYLDLDRAPLEQWTLPAPIFDTALQSPAWRCVFEYVCARFGVAGVLVSSMIGHSLDALRSPLPTALCLHDAYPAWPFLEDAPERIGDGSPQRLRARCQEAASPLFANSDPEHWLRLRAAWCTAVLDRRPTLVAPSMSARTRITRLEPQLQTLDGVVIGHAGPDWHPAPTTAPVRAQNPTLRVLIPGRVNGGKGEALLRALFALVPPEVEFVLLGAGSTGMQFLAQRGVHLQLDYAHVDLPALVAELAPDLALLPSTVEETWSYTLSEMWRLRIPVLATDLGAFAERITHASNGMLVPTDAAVIADRLRELATDRSALARLRPGPIPEIDDWLRAWHALLPAVPRPAVVTGQYDAAALRADQYSLEAGVLRDQRDRAEAAARLTAETLHQRTEWALTLEAELQALHAAAQQSEADAADPRAPAQTRLDAALAELAQTRAKLDATSVDLETAIAAQRELEAALESARSALDEAHRYYQSDTLDLARQRDIALIQRDELQQQIHELLHSHSWRLTAPLRALRRQAQTLGASLAYRWRSARSLWHRGIASLRSRGLSITLAKARTYLRRTPAASALPIAVGAAPTCPPKALATSDTPEVSIIIPAWNHCEVTLACLAALAADTPRTPYEVIVVDDASSDDSALRLPAVSGLRYLRNERNLGFIGACNAGALTAKGRWLVFLNNDTQPRSGWLDALIDSFAYLPEAGIVGAKLIYPDGRLQEAGGIVFSDGSAWNYGRFDAADDPRYNYVREVDYCSGAAIAISRELFQRLHGFDTHFSPAYYEDTDLAMRVRALGKRVYYQPASEVIHFEGLSSGTDISRGIKAYQAENQVRFLARWRQTLWRSHALPGSDPAKAATRGLRKAVLVIDACTPTPDRDSGSLRMRNLLRLLIDRGHAVCFIAENLAHDGDYTRALQQMGIEVWWHPWINDRARWMAEHGTRFQYVLLSRHYVASAWLPLARQFARGAKVLFDTVDLHYLREQREAELVADPARLRAAANTRERELRVVRDSDLTLVVSPVEQALLAREVPEAQVEVLSNMYEIAGCRRGFGQRHGLLFVGGYRHPPNVDAAIWFCRSIWPLLRASLPDVELHLIGSHAPPEIVALGDNPGVRFHGYVPDLEPWLDGCRIAVAPLRYGAGVKGKINQSMAHGQPVVATSCAAEGMHLRDGHDVLIADTPDAFATAIAELYGDEERWNRLSRNGIDNIRKHYSLQAAAQALDRIFGDAGRRQVA